MKDTFIVKGKKQKMSHDHDHDHDHHDQGEVESFYIEGDDQEDSIYDRLSDDGSYQRPDLEDIVAYLVSVDGVECRKANVERTGSRKAGEKKKKKVLYFKAKALGECFPNAAGHVTEPTDKRLVGFGNALIAGHFCTEHAPDQIRPKDRLMVPVEGADTWNPRGFYVWTSVAAGLARTEKTCCAADLIQVKGGALRKRRQQQQKNVDGGDDASDTRRVRVDRVDAKGSGGINWINIFLLLLLFGPPLMMGGIWLQDFLATSEIAQSIGLAKSHRDRLISFYDQHNPAKATIKNVDKMLLKYEGREQDLFAKLERKYEAVKIRKAAQAKAEEQDEKLLKRGEEND